MKFWTIESPDGETIGCEMKKRDAIEFAISRGEDPAECTIECIDVTVNAETIRRLLGNLGGYANN
ncbi:MAG: hypothetical protein AB9M53_00710 [Leptothrix sp. (in: b-proteobacteria)]